MALYHSPTEDLFAFPAFDNRGRYSPVSPSPAWGDARGYPQRHCSEDSQEPSVAFIETPTSPLTIWSPLTASPPRRHHTQSEMQQSPDDYFGADYLASSPTFVRGQTMPVVRRQYTYSKENDVEQIFARHSEAPNYYDSSISSPTSSKSPPMYDWKDSRAAPTDQKIVYENLATPMEAKPKSRIRRAGRRVKRMSISVNRYFKENWALENWALV